MKKKIFTGDWESQLEMQMLENKRRRRRAYICSPLKADKDAEIIRNMHSARAYMYYAWKAMGYLARAPHAYLPILMSDRVKHERTHALEFGRKLLGYSDIVLVCGKRLSEGMKLEIIGAAKRDIEIVVFNKHLYSDVKKLLSNYECRKNLVRYDKKHIFMSCQNPLIFIKGGMENV